MSRAPIFLDRAADLTLQDQIRRKLVEAIASGAMRPGSKAPSSRLLAGQLGVSRNTVVLAYQKLVSEGVLVGRERSGLYVAADATPGTLGIWEQRSDDALPVIDWSARLSPRQPGRESWRAESPDWRRYPYPFIDGLLDTSLFPLAEWREAVRQAVSVRETASWASEQGDTDDPDLVEQIRTKLLPRRGITARPDEILITIGRQQALWLALRVLARRGRVLGIEEPGSPEVRAVAIDQRWVVKPLPIDREGLLVGPQCAGCHVVATTPSHQTPTGVILSQSRREALLRVAAERDFLILEDDIECETAYEQQPLPALRGMAGGERVIYAAGLAKVLEPGLQLGFLVAEAEVIAHARRFRRLVAGQPPGFNQRAGAIFLASGAYDSTLRRIGASFRQRRLALRDALNHYLPQSIEVGAVGGGTTYWVRGPKWVDAAHLAIEAARRGVLIETVDRFYADDPPGNLFRLSVTGLPVEQIRPGVALLAELIHEMKGGRRERRAPPLRQPELGRALTGAVLLYKTVYGDPCTIELLPGGLMRGRAGFAAEDCDEGRWWLEGDLWCRRWDQWAYGETSQYEIAIDGPTIRWIRPGGREVDSAVYIAPSMAPLTHSTPNLAP